MFVFSRILSKFKLSINSRSFSTRKREYEEVCFKVPWGHVSGKWWAPYDTRPILCLHGWLDNCGTFDRLIPMINSDIGFLAIDLPGHGHSSRLPQGMFYHYKKLFLTIHSIRDSLNWPKVTLMGHSLSGVLSYMYTMLYREDVDFLICLDGLKPMSHINKVSALSNILLRFLKYNEHSLDENEPPAYSLDEMVEKIRKPNRNSIMAQYAKFILERNVAPSAVYQGKYYFTRDPRLKSGEIIDFSQEEVVHLAQQMTMPIFISKATASSYYDAKQNYYALVEVLKNVSTDCSFNYIEGSHHVHLNHPENVAPLLNEFIMKHNVGGRSTGGLTRDVIVEKKKPVVLFSDQ